MSTRPAWAATTRLWGIGGLCGAGLALLALAGCRAYQRRRFEAWLRRQMSEVGAW